jgi:hypothetical protein
MHGLARAAFAWTDWGFVRHGPDGDGRSDADAYDAVGGPDVIARWRV